MNDPLLRGRPPAPRTSSCFPTPREIISELDRRVFGQAEAKRALATAVYNHFLGAWHRNERGSDLGPQHALLIGPTGVGKTHMMRCLAEVLGVPVGFSSATGLVEAGYVGKSVETVVKDLLDRANGDVEVAERGIIFIDEIDKIRRTEENVRDVSGGGVQNALLTLLDGRRCTGATGKEHPPVDTGKILFVCSGAFVGLDEIVTRRLDLARDRVGFTTSADARIRHDFPGSAFLRNLETGDLVDFGFIPELVGRFARVATLRPLSREDLRHLLEDLEDSPLDRQRAIARIHGIDLVYTAEAVDAIADAAFRLGTGARGLGRVAALSVEGLGHQWPDLADQGVTRIVVDVSRGHQSSLTPIFVKGDPVFSRRDGEARMALVENTPSPSVGTGPNKA